MKVTEIKRPLRKGEELLVPCIVKKVPNKTYDRYSFLYEERDTDFLYVTPVIFHEHSDRENGQKEKHFHVDYRFVKTKSVESEYQTPHTINNHSKHTFVTEYRPEKGVHGEIEWIKLPVIRPEFIGITHPKLIKNSKLKHKCIHKGKCPHRGMDLSQVPEKDGVITCPLHGLKFNAKTKELI